MPQVYASNYTAYLYESLVLAFLGNVNSNAHKYSCQQSVFVSLHRFNPLFSEDTYKLACEFLFLFQSVIPSLTR